MRVLILYNEPVLPDDHVDSDAEQEVLFTADEVSGYLKKAGHEVAQLGVARDPRVLLDGVRKHRPEVIFNLFEGLGDTYETEAYLAGLLEWLGIPYTGSPPSALMLARSKHLTKQLLKGAGLPTPDFLVVERLPMPPCPLRWPVIVKPANQDASIGLDQGSVVTEPAQLERRVAWVLENYGAPVLVEQFIRGREFNMGLIGVPELRVLPVAEILFLEKDPSIWPIVTYDAKWKPGCQEYEATPPVYPAKVTPRLAERLGQLAEEAFALLGCRDYARVDFRVLPSGQCYILEVNPNPDFSPLAGFAGGLKAAGLTHEQFTLDLVSATYQRGKASATAARNGQQRALS